jgi:hypothetical protein
MPLVGGWNEFWVWKIPLLQVRRKVRVVVSFGAWVKELNEGLELIADRARPPPVL